MHAAARVTDLDTRLRTSWWTKLFVGAQIITVRWNFWLLSPLHDDWITSAEFNNALMP
jgi:hypothetical protein